MRARRGRSTGVGDRLGIRGARQHNLQNLSLDLPLGRWTVITGVSGSGKSSLAFDTLFAEGQRRYVETFSPYARQFLDRMPRPQVDEIRSILPAIAIDQNHPVKTSRSTVGTMTELTDYLKVLFFQAAELQCDGCGQPVRVDSPATIADELLSRAGGQPWLLGFPLSAQGGDGAEAVGRWLESEGVRRLWTAGRLAPTAGAALTADTLAVVDRLSPRPADRGRLVDSLERCLQLGAGRAAAVGPDGSVLPFSCALHCARCDRGFPPPTPALFSFNSPLGACPVCRGFGRTVAIDPERVVPDPSLSLAAGAIRPWRSGVARACLKDLLRFCRRTGIPAGAPYRELSARQRRWIWEGRDEWYGVRGFFDWLEERRYKVQNRVLLSRYRGYTRCHACGGSRLRPEALRYRLGGLHLGQVLALPIDQARTFFESVVPPAAVAPAAALLLAEVRSRLRFLSEVGLGYLGLDRQSRTLSGGEVQRVDLARALGAALVNTLYVLDEPSIGLHPRDVGRLIGVLGRLRDAGNTLVVVEHDPELIRAADHLVDLGPGAGERGGRLVFEGPPAGLRGRQDSATARHLFPGDVPKLGRPRRAVDPGRCIRIRGASQHNLQELDVDLPLGLLVAVTGVSGSGKSTLVRDVLFQHAEQRRGAASAEPGRCRSLEGLDAIHEVVLVDQESVPRSPAVTPATYLGAFGPLREHYASLPGALQASLTAGDFSLRSGSGRCPECGGAGSLKIEMQFLSDEFTPCAACGGRRYRDPILEVRDRGKSIADALDLTVDEAREFFAERPRLVAGLEPLRQVGLGYLRLGQPASTLSGGEAQRLRLAAAIGASRGRRSRPTAPTLFLFDEPTTGLHAADVAVLLQALGHLLAGGHSVIAIEHNLDVVRGADWVIDLGPEGGPDGGRLVCQGTPEAIAGCPESHTGQALRAAQAPAAEEVPAPATPGRACGEILIQGAREHNLRSLEVGVPRDRLVAVTGVSGSGKSTLAFDILFAEGQRRYLDSVSAYARQFVSQLPRPDVDRVVGLPPAVAVEQRLSRSGRRSTVATVTEIAHFLRLYYARLGEQRCPDCDQPIQLQTPRRILERLRRDHGTAAVRLLVPLVQGRKGFHQEVFELAARRGLGPLRVDGRMLAAGETVRLARYREHDIDALVGRLPAGRERGKAAGASVELIRRGLELGKGVLWAESVHGQTLLSSRRACPECGRGFAAPEPRWFSFNSPRGGCPACAGLGVAGAADLPGEAAEPSRVCPRCRGTRLRPESLAITVVGRHIAAWQEADVSTALRELDERLSAPAELRAVAASLRDEIAGRLRVLQRLGLGYLGLDRAGDTLSGGESQRLRLAAQLGSNLRGVCYVVDEPTIGLHPRDGGLLVQVLQELRDRGNTVVVVEHDEATIRAADCVIDLGPGAGRDGGRVVAQGTPRAIQAVSESATGRRLRRRRRSSPGSRRPARGALELRGVCHHNLRGLDLSLPLGCLVAVTGVSGSGKSSLVTGVLVPAIAARFNGRALPRGRLSSLRGLAGLGRVLWVDQSPIGRTPRSNVATYTGVLDTLRELWAGLPEARVRGYRSGRFSFNTPGGRCDKCAGQGRLRLEMRFLPDVFVTCDACGGRRYNPDTLAVRYRGRSIAEALEFTAKEALDFFSEHRQLRAKLEMMVEVGLGYLTLGQASPTLSGGEAQRIKLVAELARGGTARTLYVLEEPTTGLHGQDVELLVGLLWRLVDRGDTVVVVEHNLEVIAAADWVIDLGPEAGEGGGRVVCQGRPEAVAACRSSHTGRFLRQVLPKPRPNLATPGPVW